MGNKRKVEIDKYHNFYEDKSYIKVVFNSKPKEKGFRLNKKTGHYERKFLYDKRFKHIKDWKQERANEKAIFNFFNKKAKDYNPTSKNQFSDSFKIFIKKHGKDKQEKQQRIYKIGSREIVTNKPLSKATFNKTSDYKGRDFDFMYIEAKVKIYFNGVYTTVKQRGNIYYRKIKKTEIRKELNLAIRRCLAPYGSNLEFQLIDWRYSYHKPEYRGERYM